MQVGHKHLPLTLLIRVSQYYIIPKAMFYSPVHFISMFKHLKVFRNNKII